MKNKVVYDFLKKFTIFKDLNEYEMEPIVDFSKSRVYRSGTLIFMQDEPITNVYFIQQGKVKIYKSDLHGKEQIVNILQPGDMFPHQGFFRKGNYPAHAEVVGEAQIVHIPIVSFENFLLTHPEISIKLFRVLGDVIVDLHTRLEEQILHNVYEQIILLILRLGRTHGEKLNGNNCRITAQFTNRELANMIGSSRETVSRTLTQLKKDDLIYTDNSGYITFDCEVLENEVFK